MTDAAYLSLADNLDRQLRRAEPGSRLPSEHALATEHGVSRITTRAALQELERRNLVVRRRGSGTFVAPRIDYPISPTIPPSFTETIRRAGHEPDTRVLSIRKARPPARVRTALGRPVGTSLTALRRLSLVDGHEAGLHVSWLPGIDADELRDRIDDGGSLFDVLTRLGHDVRRDHYTAELDTIPAEVADVLRLEGRPQAWRTVSCNACHRSGDLVELAESWIRADVIRVRFELGPTDHQPTEGTR